MSRNYFALIMAGGQGTRFWPESRQKRPKQFLNILGGSESMLQVTYKRLMPLFSPEQIWVITGAMYKDEVKTQLPEVPVENIIGEPMGRNTAPCIGLSALLMRKRESGAVMACLPADHYMGDEESFLKALKSALLLAQKGDYLITMGIRPTSPNTGYGYIERGEPFMEIDGKKAFHVQSFKEKPDMKTAIRYMQEGRYLWNSGIFVWRASFILKKIEQHLPGLSQELMVIDKAVGTKRQGQAIEDAYSHFEGISIDYGVMEKERQGVLVFEGAFGWNDVGSWAALEEVKAPLTDARACLLIDSSGLMVHAPNKLVAAIGLKDLIVVDSGDALLLCPKDRAQEVKDIVEELKRRGMREYL